MGTLVEIWVRQGEATKGFAAGEALVRAAGKAEGKARGEAKSLMRLLVKRFGTLPAPVVAQIAAGRIEELDRWFDAAITASSIEAVFGGAARSLKVGAALPYSNQPQRIDFQSAGATEGIVLIVRKKRARPS